MNPGPLAFYSRFHQPVHGMDGDLRRPECQSALESIEFPFELLAGPEAPRGPWKATCTLASHLLVGHGLKIALQVKMAERLTTPSRRFAHRPLPPVTHAPGSPPSRSSTSPVTLKLCSRCRTDVSAHPAILSFCHPVIRSSVDLLLLYSFVCPSHVAPLSFACPPHVDPLFIRLSSSC